MEVKVGLLWRVVGNASVWGHRIENYSHIGSKMDKNFVFLIKEIHSKKNDASEAIKNAQSIGSHHNMLCSAREIYSRTSDAQPKKFISGQT